MSENIDGVKKELAGLKIMANINFAADVSDALDSHADGIGLYRMERRYI